MFITFVIVFVLTFTLTMKSRFDSMAEKVDELNTTLESAVCTMYKIRKTRGAPIDEELEHRCVEV